MDELTLLRELAAGEPMDDGCCAPRSGAGCSRATPIDREPQLAEHGRRRRRWALVAVAAALVVGVARHARVRDRQSGLDFVRGAPAPPRFRRTSPPTTRTGEQMLANLEKAGIAYLYSWPVATGRARGVFAIESPDGPIYLWSAPTEDGRVRPSRRSSCDRTLVRWCRRSGSKRSGACDDGPTERLDRTLASPTRRSRRSRSRSLARATSRFRSLPDTRSGLCRGGANRRSGRKKRTRRGG